MPPQSVRPMTVAEAVGTSPLDQAVVLAGLSGLADRTIRWVDIIHSPASEFVRAGDLVLTTDAGPDSETVHRFLVDIVQSDAAGLVLSLPRAFEDPALLRDVLTRAERARFPVLSLAWDIPFADVTQTVVRCLVSAEESGLTRDLLGVHGAQETGVENLLSPLLSYDERRRGNLVKTLRAYLDENCNTSAAARTLYLNRHSMIYRIKQIESLTGLSLKSSRDRFLLDASLRLQLPSTSPDRS